MDEYFKDIEIQRTYTPDSQRFKDKPKKFVFQIYPENINYIESLSYEDKNILINQLISNYKKNSYTKDYSNENKNYKKLIINIIALIIMIPIILFIINISLQLTSSNYGIYQGNFEKLFKNHQY